MGKRRVMLREEWRKSHKHPYSHVGRSKSNKMLHDKYVSTLAIKYGHVGNLFSDKFIPLCHVDNFLTMMDESWWLDIFVILLTLLMTKFYIYIFQGHICQRIILLGIKVVIYPKNKNTLLTSFYKVDTRNIRVPF